MEDCYQNENCLKGEGQQNLNYNENQGSPIKACSLNYLTNFNQEEKAKIFNNVYSCIKKFYQFVDDSLQK